MEELFKKASRVFGDLDAYHTRPYGIWADIQFAKDPTAGSNLDLRLTIMSSL